MKVAQSEAMSELMPYGSRQWRLPVRASGPDGVPSDSRKMLESIGVKVVDQDESFYLVSVPDLWYPREIGNASSPRLLEIVDPENGVRFYLDQALERGRVTMHWAAPAYEKPQSARRRDTRLSPAAFSGIVMAIFLGFCFLAHSLFALTYQITEDEATARFEQLTGKEVKIIHASNNSIITGDPGNVRYELTIDGQPATGDCSNGFFTEMTCRVIPSK